MINFQDVAVWINVANWTLKAGAWHCRLAFFYLILDSIPAFHIAWIASFFNKKNKHSNDCRTEDYDPYYYHLDSPGN
jgi:hypothetical protein